MCPTQLYLGERSRLVPVFPIFWDIYSAGFGREVGNELEREKNYFSVREEQSFLAVLASPCKAGWNTRGTVFGTRFLSLALLFVFYQNVPAIFVVEQNGPWGTFDFGAIRQPVKLLGIFEFSRRALFIPVSIIK